MQVLMQQHMLPEGVTLNVVDQLPENEPVSAVLNSRRVRDYFGVQARTWRPSLLPMIKQWLHKHVEEA
jgi:dTDP-4-dehydrorhamnose reductase